MEISQRMEGGEGQKRDQMGDNQIEERDADHEGSGSAQSTLPIMEDQADATANHEEADPEGGEEGV